MLESGSSGSVRGASSNGRPYREPRSGAVGSECLAKERSCGSQATRQAATIDVNAAR
jgi:hypothetical protein